MSKVTIRYTTQVEVDIDLKRVEDYLISKGWVEEGPYGEFGREFSNRPFVVVLMTTDKIGDWNGRMNDLIHGIAAAEKRTVPELLDDLASFKFL